MSTLVIVNPGATTAHPRVLGTVIEALASWGEIRVRATEARGHAVDLAAAACTDGTGTVIVVGGDGTVNEVVNGLMAGGADAPRPVLGVVPAGHTNVLSRTLGFPNDPVEATGLLLDGLRAGSTRRIGLGRVDDRYFAFSAGLGLDAEVLARVEQQRARGARASLPLYVASTIVAHAAGLLNGRPGLSVEFPDREPLTDVYTLIVQNAPVWTYFGNLSVTFAPEAAFADGLALYGLRSLDALSLSNDLARATLRPSRLSSDPGASDLDAFTVRCAEPVPLQVDGDVVGDRTEAHFTSIRQALTVVVAP